MKKLNGVAIPAAFGLAIAAPALMAQDGDAGDAGSDVEVEDTETEVEIVESNGAVVTRAAITEDVEIVDENGDPVLDAEGNPTYETVETGGWVQTVETPSGNRHTITKVEGERAVVTHEKAERVARADRPEKPERPAKPERPEKPEKPERPSRGG